ncbi:MAG: hypothetical protein ACFFBL_03085 [Promethearchaeota archaeon]
MSQPKKEDAELLIQLFAIARNDDEAIEANWWVFEKLDVDNYDEFKSKYPFGSEGDRMVRIYASYGELAGVLVNRGLLSEDLAFDWLGDFAWGRLGPIVQGMRKEAKMPRLFENYEVLAKKYPEWAEKNPPKV